MKSFLSEFKAFIAKGNIIDMSVGIIVGGAFNKIVSSLVNDLLMPILGIATGRVDLTNLKYSIPVAGDGAVISIKYGMFLQSVVDFLIIAVAIFIAIKFLYSVRVKHKEKELAEEKAEEEKITPEQRLLTEIRDLLKAEKEAPGV